MSRPKYIDTLRESLERQAKALERKATDLSINCGTPRREMPDCLEAAQRLARAAEVLCKELTPRR